MHVIGWLALSIGMLLQPTALVYKASVLGEEFSISYFFYAIFFFLGFLGGIRKFRFLLRGNLVSLCYLALILLVAYSLVFRSGDNATVLLALLFTALSILYGLGLFWSVDAGFSKLILSTGFFLCFIGLILFEYNLPLFDPVVTGSALYFMDENGVYRAMGVFMNPNNFGYFLVFMGCILLSFKKIRPIYRLVACVLLIYLILATGSRSSVAAGVFVCVIHVLSSCFRKKSGLLLKVILMTTVVFMMFVLFNLDNFLDFDVRARKWIVGWEIFTGSIDYIILGVPGSIDLKIFDDSFSDNLFLLFLFRLGLIGFTLFLVFYFSTIAMAINSLKNNPGFIERAMALYVISTLILMFISNFLVFVPANILFGISVGVLMVCHVLRKIRHTPGKLALYN